MAKKDRWSVGLLDSGALTVEAVIETPLRETGLPRAASRDPIYYRRRYPAEVIELCVRWYLTYRLSYRDLVAMMAERDVAVSHTTIIRWVQRYVPEFERRWARFSKPTGSSWRMDETAVPVRGQRQPAPVVSAGCGPGFVRNASRKAFAVAASGRQCRLLGHLSRGSTARLSLLKLAHRRTRWNSRDALVGERSREIPAGLPRLLCHVQGLTTAFTDA